MDDEELNQEPNDASEGSIVATGVENVGERAVEKATDAAKEIAKETAKKEAKEVSKRASFDAVKQAVTTIRKGITKVLLALGPYIIIVVALIAIIIVAIVHWGIISEVPGKIKDAFLEFTSNISALFEFDDSTNTYTISDEKLDKVIEDLEKSEVRIEDYDLSKDDLKSFLEADLVTQSVDGFTIEDTKGAIKIYMTDPNDESEGLGARPLTYMPFAEFDQKLKDANSNEEDNSVILNRYTVDSANNVIVAAKNESWRYVDGDETSHKISYTTKSFGYKTATAQYEMPLMFFIDTCLITDNKDYVLELAKQVKNTEIIITVQDAKTRTYNRYERTVTVSDGQGGQYEETIVIEEIDETNALTPTVTKADTLLYTKEMIYTNKVEVTTSGGKTITANKYSPGIDKEIFIKSEEFEKTAKSKDYPKGEVYNSLITGGDMLFEILSRDVNNETIEQTLKYIFYELSGVDFGVTSLDSSIFKLGEIRNISDTQGGGYNTFIEYLHKWESHEGISSDGTMYRIGTDGYGNPTVGYGVDIFNGGFAERFRAAGYSTTVGDYVPVEFVDAIEQEEINECIDYIKTKTAELNLTQYQIYALASRAYNCGKESAISVRNGKTFIEAYKAYWNEEIDGEYKVPKNDGMFDHNLYKTYMYKPNTAKTKNGSVFSKGLENRRKSEWILFKTGYFDVIDKYCETTASGNAGSILEAAEEIHSYMEQNGYSYCLLGYEKNQHSGAHGLNQTFEESKTGHKLTCCATYVSWVLRKAGLIDFTCHGALNLGEALVRKGFQQVSYSEMEAGDIVILKRTGGGHTQIYAGDGKWYNAGSVSSVQNPAPYAGSINTSNLVYVLRAPSS